MVFGVSDVHLWTVLIERPVLQNITRLGYKNIKRLQSILPHNVLPVARLAKNEYNS